MSQTASCLARLTEVLVESRQSLPLDRHEPTPQALRHKGGQVERRAVERETRRLCQQEHSRAATSTFVVVFRIDIDLAKQLEDTGLLATIDILLQGFGHRGLLRLVATKLYRLLD